jgi:hypothetical protein
MLKTTTCKPLDIMNDQADLLDQASQLLVGSSRMVHFRTHGVAIMEDTRASAKLGCKTEKRHGEVSQIKAPKGHADTSGSSLA